MRLIVAERNSNMMPGVLEPAGTVAGIELPDGSSVLGSALQVSRQRPHKKKWSCERCTCSKPDVPAAHEGCSQTIRESMVVDEVGPGGGGAEHTYLVHVHTT
jgi:hypothetical protein